MEKLKFRNIPGPKSKDLLQKAQTFEPACSLDQTPVVWDHGDGVWIWDVDGNPYIDFTSGVLVTNLGHSHKGLTKAIQEQAERLQNTYSFPTPERIEAAERLVKTLPSHLTRVFYLTTGSEATEAAIRVARRYSQKTEILSFYGGFHGRTYGAMSVGGMRSIRNKFGEMVPGSVRAPYAYCYRCIYEKTYPDCGFYCIKALDDHLRGNSNNNLGAVMVEPYQGAAGFIFPPDGWLKALEQWTKERDLVFIVDEVQSSFGRTGRMYAIEWEGVKPDLLCLGKGLGSGLPVSALAGTDQVLEAMDPGELSSTWGGNPLCSSATLAVLTAIEQENLSNRSLEMGNYLTPILHSLQEKYPCIGDVRGRALVQGLEIVEPDDGFSPSKELTRKIVFNAAERGLLLGKVGIFGNVIRLAPPLVIKKEEIDLAMDILEQSIALALD
ncbi:MAG: aspartate aminotransferase family protein [Candidatus Cloacimonetes bacterium]|nr:aspartate aminotransferase family protein [Candidatus Cloacimonadota bacterium]